MKEKLTQGLFFGCLKGSIFVVNSEISFKIFLSLQRMNLTFKTSVCPTFRINSTGSLPGNGAIQTVLLHYMEMSAQHKKFTSLSNNFAKSILSLKQNQEVKERTSPIEYESTDIDLVLTAKAFWQQSQMATF